MSDGTRTRDRLDHNQELYQLSYAHHARDCASGQSSNRAADPAIGESIARAPCARRYRRLMRYTAFLVSDTT